MQHLLTDQRDPFNRMPMTEEQVVPQPELRARVAEWLAAQRAERAAKMATAAAPPAAH
jgi:ubiquitin conjugation factor E4 B